MSEPSFKFENVANDNFGKPSSGVGEQIENELLAIPGGIDVSEMPDIIASLERRIAFVTNTPNLSVVDRDDTPRLV